MTTSVEAEGLDHRRLDRGWLLRPSLCFVVASMAVTILHELTHACVAWSLGVPSTLYSYFANVNLTAGQAATNLPVIFGVSGPLVCLVLGCSAGSRTGARGTREPG